LTDLNSTALQGRRAIITGAGSGIGRASALLFAAHGASVLAVDKAEASVAETARLVQERGGICRAVAADAGSEQDVQRYVQEALESFGGIDVLFANAGISGPLKHSLFDQDAAFWQSILQVNLIGPFLAIKYAAPHMVAQEQGSIICTASVAGLRAGAGPHPYSASKAGVINLVQTAANSLVGTGVRVNAICPGIIETGMTEPIFAGARAHGSEGKIGQLNPLQRYGRAEEIAQVALFLASAQSSYVNGQAIAVDGGRSSSLPVAPGRPRLGEARS
jgi:NAD(P)-dependent dehydrogenase (short-subunit alcohol dehydrogenase family)